MKFHETRLPGAYLIDPEPIQDARGSFQRVWCAREFAEHGIEADPAQANLSTNRASGTLRGLHLQLPPKAESKLVRCTRGAVWDVIVDLRPDSPTFLEHVGERLSAENRRALFVPELFAHGYLTLESGSEVLYQVSEFYAPGHERGIRWDDPSLGIEWPVPAEVVSDKDANWPDIDPEALRHEIREALAGNRPVTGTGR